MAMRIGERTEGIVIVHVDAPRMRANVDRQDKLPIIRIARVDGTTLAHCHQVVFEGPADLDTRDMGIPGYPNAICVVRTMFPVRRVR